VPEAAAPMGAPSNGATMPESEVSEPLGNDPPGHAHRPHHHDHPSQPKMPQAGMHGAGIAMGGGQGRGMWILFWGHIFYEIFFMVVNLSFRFGLCF
jgi:hypothetical protein